MKYLKCCGHLETRHITDEDGDTICLTGGCKKCGISAGFVARILKYRAKHKKAVKTKPITKTYGRGYKAHGYNAPQDELNEAAE